MLRVTGWQQTRRTISTWRWHTGRPRRFARTPAACRGNWRQLLVASKWGKQQNRFCRKLHPLIDKLIGGDDLCEKDSKIRHSNNGEARFAPCPEKEQVRPLFEAATKPSQQHNCVFCNVQVLVKAESAAPRLCLQNSLCQCCLTMGLSVRFLHTVKQESNWTTSGCSSYQSLGCNTAVSILLVMSQRAHTPLKGK